MECIPLTSEQQFIHRMMRRLGADSAALNIPVAVRIGGLIDVARLRHTAAGLAARMPVLRARLSVNGDGPAHWRDDGEVAFVVLDMMGAGEDEIDRVLAEQADACFDLMRQCPLRIVLALAAPDEAHLMLVGHHMFVDENGLNMVLEQLLADPADPADSGGPCFLDYAALHQRWLTDGTYAEKAKYWRDEFAAADPALHLSGRTPNPAGRSPAGLVSHDFAAEFHRALADQAVRLEVTPLAVALGATYEAMWDFTDQDELVISVVTDTRRPPFGRTVGQFTKPILTHRHRVGRGLDEMTLRRGCRQTMDAIDNQVPPHFVKSDLPWLSRRVAGGYAMSDVCLDYRPQYLTGAEIQELAGRPVSRRTLRHRRQEPGIPYQGMVLGFTIVPEAAGLRGIIQYDRQIIDDAKALDLVALWEKALTRAVEEPMPWDPMKWRYVRYW
jgi:hypothetical protein